MDCMTIGDVWSFPGAEGVEAEWDVVVGVGVDDVVVVVVVVAAAAAAAAAAVVVVGVGDQPGWPALRKS